MIQVEIQNFQSIAKQVVEIEGFAAVVGRSNIGKSAVARAVKAAFTGAPADDYVRHGSDCLRVQKGAKHCKCFCSVRIRGDQVDLLWEKGDSVNRYVFNGKEYSVVGRGTPDFLGEPFAPVSLGSDRVLLQVFDQFAPLFLLDRSGTVVADALSDVAKLNQINDAARLVERDRKECSVTRKVRQKDIRELEEAEAAYEGLDEALVAASNLEAVYEKAVELDATWRRLCEVQESVQRIESEIDVLVAAEDCVIPNTAGLVGRQRHAQALERLADGVPSKVAAIKALAGVEEVTVPDIQPLIQVVKAYELHGRWTTRLRSLKEFFEGKTAAATEIELPELHQCPALAKTHERLEQWCIRLAAIAGAIESLGARVGTIEASETEVLAEFDALGICPTCQQPLRTTLHRHGEDSLA